VKLESLSEIGIRNSRLEEIKKLSSAVPLSLDREEETIIYSKYWQWNPYHFRDCPDADTGDINLSPADLNSGESGELVKAFELLHKVIYFVKTYQPTDLSILVNDPTLTA